MDFDYDKIAEKDGYKLLTSVVVPRPIALATTVDRDGVVNAAPFSFFNAVSFDPPLVILGVEAYDDARLKDTGENIRRTPEFVVNIVDEPLAQRMNVCAVEFPAGVNELEKAGLTPAPSVKIKPPRIAEAPASIECRRFVTLEVGPRSRNLVLGEVVHLHIRDDIVDPETLYVDVAKLGAVGRLNAAFYARTGDRFEMPRMSYAEWQARQAANGPPAGRRRTG